VTTVYCSGLFSGPNPSPGLGVARSLREAFPALHLVGVDYSTRSTGLHHPVFDEVWIQRPWRELDLDAYAEAIADRLNGGALWISGLDLETRWLANSVGARPGLLSPSAHALRAVEKPPAGLADRLALALPPTITTSQDDWELHAFGREHGWNLWLKGPHYQAVRVDSWQSLRRARAALSKTWSTDELHLQAHVPGAEESIVFAAHEGQLVGARHMRKGIVTEEGKTWAGSVHDADETVPDLAAAAAAELSGLSWTGGGEIEMLRSADGGLWLIECNPRFPAWLHGVTIAGANLPGALVEAATGASPIATDGSGSEFVRVVIEIPLRPGFPLPEPVPGSDGAVSAGKHPSGMPDLAKRIADDRPEDRRQPPTRPDGRLHAAVAALRPAPSTPHSHLTKPASRWTDIAARAREASHDGPEVRIAYSVKTNPHPTLLERARACGLLAEAISADEVRRALGIGFAGGDIVLNGPAKRWPRLPEGLSTFATFADSTTELARISDAIRSGTLSSSYIGPRLRPPSIGSRFGVQLDDFDTFSELVRLLDELPGGQPLGVHFHWASSSAGHEAWFDAVEAALTWSASLQELTDRPVRCLDLGGGWFPDDFESVLLPRLPALVRAARDTLEALEVLVLEPGKALTQPLSVVEATVLELRRASDTHEVVLDASIAELPEAHSYPHRLLSEGADGWLRWRGGPDRVLGRLCMEADVICAGVTIPEDLRPGARVLIADCGAYDRSMSYDFGRG
jgi:diaminopimelate decarboxylase